MSRADAKQAAALDTLNAWFTAKGSDVSGSALDAWNISHYRDAFLFSSGQGRRSNSLYIVLGQSVCWLSAGSGSLEDAYRSIGGTVEAPTSGCAAMCPSTIHKVLVPGTVSGLFRNSSSDDTAARPVTYCATCAEAGEAFGFFTPAEGTE